MNQHKQYIPIIAVLTQPSQDLYREQYPSDQFQYISSSYVKWLWSSGCRVIPLPFDTPEEKLESILRKVNGVLFTGGNSLLWENEQQMQGFSPYQIKTNEIINKIIKLNDEGIYLPLMGTCQGLEQIILGITNDDKSLQKFVSFNHTLNTQITQKGLKSKQYNYFDKLMQESISKEKPLYYNHKYAVSLEYYNQNDTLRKFFNVTATAKDKDEKEFAASFEGVKYPIFINQFHPEKNAFEWMDRVHANHSEKAIVVAQQFGFFFVNEAKKNKSMMEFNEFMKIGIDVFPCQHIFSGFVSAYIFENNLFAQIKIDSQENINQQQNNLQHL